MAGDPSSPFFKRETNPATATQPAGKPAATPAPASATGGARPASDLVRPAADAGAVNTVPTDPKQFQAFLNGKGANPPLVIDGVIGPKTLAAAKTLNIAVPQNLAPKPAAAPAPAPAAQQASAPVAPPEATPTSEAPAAVVSAPPTPTVTVAQLRVKYGYLGSLLDQPDIANLLVEKASDPSMADDEFLAKLYNTQTWQTTQTSVRNYIGLQSTDPAGLQARIDQTKADLTQQAQTQGIAIAPDRLTEIATNTIKLGWDPTQIQQALGSEFHYAPGGQVGVVGQQEQTIKDMASQYLVPLSDATLASWDAQIAAGTASADTFKQYIVTQAKSLWPTLSADLDHTATTVLLDPYRQIAATQLEMNPESIDFTDPKWMRAVSTPDPTTGKPSLMGLADWTKTLRTDSTYGWKYTKNGQDAAYSFQNNLLQALGKIPGA